MIGHLTLSMSPCMHPSYITPDIQPTTFIVFLTSISNYLVVWSIFHFFHIFRIINKDPPNPSDELIFFQRVVHTTNQVKVPGLIFRFPVFYQMVNLDLSVARSQKKKRSCGSIPLITRAVYWAPAYFIIMILQYIT